MTQDSRNVLERHRANTWSQHDRISQVYPFLVGLVLVLAGTFSLFFTSHKLDTLGLSLVTTAALLLSPGPYVALMRPLAESAFLDFVGKVHRVWLGALTLTGLGGIALLVWGRLEDKLSVAGSSSRLHYLLGVACLVVVTLGLLPAWLAKATKDYGAEADSLDKLAKRRLKSAYAAAGALCFIVGTILIFIGAAN